MTQETKSITQEEFETLDPIQQVKFLISEAQVIVKANPKSFINSLLGRELGSILNRHLGGTNEAPKIAERKAPKERVINHTPESFNPVEKKKVTTNHVAGNYRKMSVDELKVYAKNEYGIDTKGITNAEDIVYLIDQYKIVKEAEVKMDLEDKEIITPKEGDEEIIINEENDKGEETGTVEPDKTLADLDKE